MSLTRVKPTVAYAPAANSRLTEEAIPLAAAHESAVSPYCNSKTQRVTSYVTS
jgi:hypothetical protein